jgi:hypothetical protein
MFTANCACSLITDRVVELRSRQTRMSGGFNDSDVKALAVMPW